MKAEGAALVAVSPQLPKYSKQVVKKNNLAFPVLADTNNDLATKFGLTFTLPEELKKLYSSFGIDLVRFNGNESWALPMSGRFIIDSQGNIKSREVHPDYTVRPDPTEIIDILKTMQ